MVLDPPDPRDPLPIPADGEEANPFIQQIERIEYFGPLRREEDLRPLGFVQDPLHDPLHHREGEPRGHGVVRVPQGQEGRRLGVQEQQEEEEDEPAPVAGLGCRAGSCGELRRANVDGAEEAEDVWRSQSRRVRQERARTSKEKMNFRHALVPLAVPLLVTACHSQAPGVASRSTGEELLTEFWAKVYNPPQDLSAIDRLCTEDFILTTAGTDVVGRDAFKAWARSFSSKIGDMRLTNLDMFSSADGKRVVSRWKVTGFNRGILGTPADDRPIEFTGIAVWEVRDGKLAHNWVERSAYELEQRLKQPAE